MAIWRVQLKTEPKGNIGYSDVLEFCKSEHIIGVGWPLIRSTADDHKLKEEINSSNYESKKSAYQAINAIRQMKTGDLIWTRLGGNASIYYLCRVGNTLWKDRVVTSRHEKHDIGNFVSADWVKIGTEDRVPGKVVNSLCVSRTAQSVNGVDEISKLIWNIYSDNSKPKYKLSKLDK